MQKKILVVLCCLLSSSSISGDEDEVKKCFKKMLVDNCGKNDHHRIVGGSTVKRGDHPWMVSIQVPASKGYEHFCGGSIINENWIITAAHCVADEPDPKGYLAVIGLLKQSKMDDHGVQKIKIAKVFPHEKFDGTVCDIALLKTQTPMELGAGRGGGRANAVCLPTSPRDPKGDAVVVGWGFTKENGENSDVLRHVSVPMVSRSQCKEGYPQTDLKTMICAGKEGKDACQSDSGGPLLKMGRKDERATLIGIVSFGHGCAEEGFPGVYTKVAAFVPWMCSTMFESKQSKCGAGRGTQPSQ